MGMNMSEFARTLFGLSLMTVLVAVLIWWARTGYQNVEPHQKFPFTVLPSNTTVAESVGNDWYWVEIEGGKAEGCYLFKFLSSGLSLTNMECNND